MKNYPMRKIAYYILTLSLFTVSTAMVAQTKQKTEQKEKVRPYHAEDNAQQKIDLLVTKASKEKKNIILQAGGNWCSWCLLFNEFKENTAEVKKALNAGFLYYHLNYSPENKNEAVFKKYAPEGHKLGYPFFIVLNSKGEVIKIQESGSLEQGKGYNKEKVLKFLASVSPLKK